MNSTILVALSGAYLLSFAVNIAYSVKQRRDNKRLRDALLDMKPQFDLLMEATERQEETAQIVKGHLDEMKRQKEEMEKLIEQRRDVLYDLDRLDPEAQKQRMIQKFQNGEI